jgi:hypothetical protein
MADFLMSLDANVKGERLLRVLRQPFTQRTPGGWAFDYPWGSAAVLEDPIARGRNCLQRADAVVSWVGDLVLSRDEASVDAALGALARDAEPRDRIAGVVTPRLCEQVTGAFAMFGTGPKGFWVMTDPMASVQVYLGRSRAGGLLAVGTHPDLVACCLDEQRSLDLDSVGDFLNTGTPCCPYTMYRNVTEIAPGTICVVEAAAGGAATVRERVYWHPPAELELPLRESELVEAFVECWRKAIEERCVGGKLGVELSGGLDSRIVISCLPPGTPCAALTLCDGMNREARVARRVAGCYGREWVPLERDPEYLARTFLTATRFTGCEGEWHHGHAVGFSDRVIELGINSLFTGLLMDNNFKGYYGADMIRENRAGGLLPARFQSVRRDYADEISSFCRMHLMPERVEATRERRRIFAATHFATGRTSAWEWLDGYPYSQSSDNTGWTIERRLMPIRLPVMDRALVDLAFRVPITLKAGGRFFEQAAVRLLGPGNAIPSANDGVRPGSGHVSRLAQRAMRKVERCGRDLASSLGLRLQVPHSWHDYDRYWLESPDLGALKREHGPRLEEFEGSVFRGSAEPHLYMTDHPWRTKYRILQLAVWRSLIEAYRL